MKLSERMRETVHALTQAHRPVRDGSGQLMGVGTIINEMNEAIAHIDAAETPVEKMRLHLNLYLQREHYQQTVNRGRARDEKRWMDKARAEGRLAVIEEILVMVNK